MGWGGGWAMRHGQLKSLITSDRGAPTACRQTVWETGCGANTPPGPFHTQSSSTPPSHAPAPAGFVSEARLAGALMWCGLAAWLAGAACMAAQLRKAAASLAQASDVGMHARSQPAAAHHAPLDGDASPPRLRRSDVVTAVSAAGSHPQPGEWSSRRGGGWVSGAHSLTSL
jgi:hypothetical protein